MLRHNFYIVTALSLVFGALSYFFQIRFALVIILMLLWGYCLLYSIKKINERVVLFSFLVTFFTFLLSRLFITTLFPFFQSDYTLGATSRMLYSSEAELFIYFSLIVSLAGFSVGYLSSKNNKSKLNRRENPLYIKTVRLISRKLTYLFFLFTLIVTIEKIRYIWTNGYVDFYLTYRETLPHIFYTLSFAYKFAFFIFLSSMPSRREAKPLILLYIFEACVSLLTGQRGAFLTPILFMVIYFFIRSSMSPEDPWIGRKGKLALFISLPVICVGMFLVMLIRGDNEVGNDNFFTLFLNFFYQLGGSENIIGYSYDFKSKIPDGQWYSLGPVLRFVQDNPIASLLGLGEAFQSQSVEMATRGHELGSFLTYNTDEYRYISGGNIASSYVAELWLDFGFFGVIVGNYIYGRIMGSVNMLFCSNIWITTLVLVMMNRILTAPRASFMFFVTDCLSFSFLLIVIFIVSRCKGIPHYIISKG